MQILTPSGFHPFEGVARYWHDKSLKFVFEEGNVELITDCKPCNNQGEVDAEKR